MASMTQQKRRTERDMMGCIVAKQTVLATLSPIRHYSQHTIGTFVIHYIIIVTLLLVFCVPFRILFVETSRDCPIAPYSALFPFFTVSKTSKHRNSPNGVISHYSTTERWKKKDQYQIHFKSLSNRKLASFGTPLPCSTNTALSRCGSVLYTLCLP